MQNVFRVMVGVVAVLVGTAGTARAADAPDAEALTRMLNEFLAGATVNDAAAHDRFWAEDLIYTSSNGERFGKAEIMEGLAAAAKPGSAEKAAEPMLVYSAEDIRIQQYGDTAIVAFTLLGRGQSDATEGAPPGGQRFFNTGTFLRRAGTWQVVAWQATRIPAPNPESP